MKQYCYVIINNAGHSWVVRNGHELNSLEEVNAPVLPQLLQEGWEPIRETPMGGGASQLAHSLVLLERNAPRAKAGRSKA